MRYFNKLGLGELLREVEKGLEKSLQGPQSLARFQRAIRTDGVFPGSPLSYGFYCFSPSARYIWSVISFGSPFQYWPMRSRNTFFSLSIIMKHVCVYVCIWAHICRNLREETWAIYVANKQVLELDTWKQSFSGGVVDSWIIYMSLN